MIFDAERITELVLEWQKTRDEDVLTDILEGCTSLIEAIVSEFNSVYREDLIQEAYYRIQYALPLFDHYKSSLHNYLTTVIRNICYTYSKKQDKQPVIECDFQLIHDGLERGSDGGELDLLTNLIARNRKRFPSIPVDDIDHITLFIFYALRDDGMSRNVVSQLAVRLCVDRSLAKIFYQSTVMYLRALNIQNSRLSLSSGDDEFTLLPDIKEIMGKDAYECIAVIMSGMIIKLP